MSSSGECPRRFAARRSFRNTLIFCVAFGLFFLLGLGLTVFGHRVGLVLTAFSAAFLVLLLIVNLKPGWAYLVDEAGITVLRTFIRSHIPRESITELKCISDREAGAATSGEFVLLVTTEKRIRLLSPQDPESFLEAFRDSLDR
jgi:hypothetical protein